MSLTETSIRTGSTQNGSVETLQGQAQCLTLIWLEPKLLLTRSLRSCLAKRLSTTPPDGSTTWHARSGHGWGWVRHVG